jgi:hypothetical protein
MDGEVSQSKQQSEPEVKDVRTDKGERTMAIEQQVNIQDLQRLNDAIVVTMDCIRRLAPQLAQLTHQVQISQLGLGGAGAFGGIGVQTPWTQAQFGLGMHPYATPFAYGYGALPFGQPTIDPVTANVLAQAQALRQIYGAPVTPGLGGYGLGGLGAVGGQVGLGGQVPFAGMWQQPWQQTPFLGMQQRPF